MNIGVITWFSYENYGTKLQAIALQRYLKNMGHHVQLLNFTPPELLTGTSSKESFWDKIKRQPNKYVNRYILKKNKKHIDIKCKKMDFLINQECSLTQKIKTDEDYIRVCNSFDLLICGSDQIWNPNLYHRYYFADFEQIKTPRISYAPSIGVNNIRTTIASKMKESLARFSLITVRESAGADVLKEITGRKIFTVLDPTFLLKKSEWISLTRKTDCKEKYILCYFLSDNKNHWKAARRFAKAHGLKLYIIPQQGESYIQKGKIFPECGIEDFLELISKATFVLTDSFHGTVFSILFNTQFYVFERFKENEYSSQNSRIVDLLTDVSIMQRLNKFGSSRILESPNIEYDLVNQRIEQMILNSKNILNEGLSYGKEM